MSLTFNRTKSDMPPTATPGVKDGTAVAAAQVSPSPARFLLLYGSATGQAQSIAEEIAEKSPGFGLSPQLLSLEVTGKRVSLVFWGVIIIL